MEGFNNENKHFKIHKMSEITTSIYPTRIEIRKLTGYVNGSFAICYEDNGLYKFNSTDETPDDDETYLKPYNTIVGRWVKEKTIQIENLG